MSAAANDNGTLDVPPVIIERMVRAGRREGAHHSRAAERSAAGHCSATGSRSRPPARSSPCSLTVGPEFLRQGAAALFVLSRRAEAASPYSIKVTPGDVNVPEGI